MRKILLCLIISLILPAQAIAQETTNDNMITRPMIRILNSENFTLEYEFYPFSEDSTAQGANIATADLNNDGYKEIIVATGRNEKPWVKIFNHLGKFQYQFLAYAETFQKGFKIITADLYNDGSPEIITAPNEGGGPQIRIFDNLGFAYFSFFAFDESLRGGANVSVGDVNGDSQPEIIVGAGYDQEPIIKIFDNYSNFIKAFYTYDDSFKGGISVLAADLNKDKTAEIITAPYIEKEPMIRIFDYDGNLINQFIAYPQGFWGGVNLAKSDVDRDGYLEILTGAGYSGGAHLRFFNKEGIPKINPTLFIFDNFKGGISIADGDINNDGQTEILAATQIISPIDKYDSYKSIEIDINQQKLFTYFKGQPVKEFWVSTGTWKFPTPLGEYKIYAKVPSTNMTGYYGFNHPDNYELANVPHVMPFYKNYAIHGAYWHWNFGTRVSHGCVNLKLPDAEWLYNWSHIGTPVKIHYSAQ
ncbi:MAG: L,D-transpeptidase family protein [Candidatus Buchananbacteria bacterium]|nr:L,D-transpeptidase family protein [Candidatus Buchananbacteria bacterium]